MGYPFAICSELFSTPIDETIRTVAALGFAGIEIAPFNIAEDVREVSASRRREIRSIADGEGIEIVGLHWLLVSPKGLHLTSADASIRERTAEYLSALAHFCADLGGRVMILGSPQQRNLSPADDRPSAVKRAADVLATAGEACAEREVRLLVEALHPAETNFLQTIEEVLALNAEHGHPAIGYMLDCKAMSGMPDGVVGTIEKHGRDAGHFHTNDPSGAGPGMGELQFGPVMSALSRSGYEGWVSSEPFIYEPDPATVARTALATLRQAETA